METKRWRRILGGTMVKKSGTMRSAGQRLGGFLVVALAAQFLPAGQSALAQTWPVRFEPAVPQAISAPGDGQILDSHLRTLSTPNGTTARQLLSLSDVLPYCGDGDGCHLTLLLFVGSGGLPIYRGEWDLYITSAGSAWKVFQGSTLTEVGNLTDGSLETLFLVTGSTLCQVAEELTSIGSVERFFLVAISPPASLPPGALECRLQIED